MPITNNNKKILDLPRWEPLGYININATTGQVNSGSHASWSFLDDDLIIRSCGPAFNTPYLFVYNTATDTHIPLPNTGLTGNMGSGNIMAVSTRGPTGVVAVNGNAAGTTFQIQETLRRGLTGYYVLVYREATGFYELRKILTNTTALNSTITVETAFSRQITTSDSYRIFSPKVYLAGSNSIATGSFKVYDFATNAYSNLAVLPTQTTNQGQLISTPSFIFNDFYSFASGTATGGTANTISNSAKAWTTNQWTNSIIIITAGTGAGQEREISSNTNTQITVSTNWTVTPDATSVYKICANDKYLYWIPSSTTTWYRYNISTNTWQTSPTGIANIPATGTNRSSHWIWDVTNADWSNENNIKNGRFIYSRRTVTATQIQFDVYDIALNSWSLTPSSAVGFQEALASDFGCYIKNKIYFSATSDTRKIYAYDILSEAITTGTPMVPDAVVRTPIQASCLWWAPFKEGNTQFNFLYFGGPSNSATTPLFRMMVIND